MKKPTNRWRPNYLSNLVAIFTLPILLSISFLSEAQITNDCSVPQSCSDLKVEMVRVYDNTSSSCATAIPDFNCSDGFRQMAYKVYLRYRMPNPGTPGGPGSVNLNYKSLDIAVSLAGNGLHSKINTGITEECFKTSTNGHYWNLYEPPTGQTSNKPIFQVTDHTTSISFSNQEGQTGDCGGNSPNGGGNVLTFSFSNTAPPNVDANSCGQNYLCAYLELFTVIVDAYPEETISLKVDKADYMPKVTPSSICQLATVNSGIHQATQSITISTPLSNTNTNNVFLEARIGNPVATSISGQYEVPVLLVNTNTQNMIINPSYVEFLVSSEVHDLLTPYEYLTQIPEVIETVNSSNNTYVDLTRTLHYKINLSSVSIAPGSSYTLCTIKVGPNDLENIGWNASFQIIENSKSRLKTKINGIEVCTNLKLQNPNPPVTVMVVGNIICQAYDIKYFNRLTPVSTPGNCNDFLLQVGLREFGNIFPNGFKIAGLEIKFRIKDPNITFGSPINTSNWPDVNCSGVGSCGPECYYITQSTNEFRYCFDFTNPTDAVLFFNNNYSPQYFEIPIHIPDGSCLKDIVLEHLSYKYFDEHGVATICVPLLMPSAGFPQCPSGISGKLQTDENFEGVENATVTVVPSGGSGCTTTCMQSIYTFSNDSGQYGFCQICKTCDKYTVTPSLELDPLNGVNTYDLILISRHILGLEPLSTPYKLISADANKSGTVTTFDIVELRKLILGTYTVLPNNSSWRFINKQQMFSNPNNPWFNGTVIQENIEVSAPLPANNLDFVACKIGDVDITATPNQKTGLSVTTIGWARPVASKKSTITFPVYYLGDAPVIGLQFGLSFDPNQLSFIGASGGDVGSLSELNFGRTKEKEGSIAFSWNVMDAAQTPVKKDDILFYLTFEVIQDFTDAEFSLDLQSEEEYSLQALAWESSGTPFRIVHSTLTSAAKSEKAADIKAQVVPNPANNNAVLQLQSPQSGTMRFAIMNAYGQRLSLRNVQIIKGIQEVPITEVGKLTAGIYQWWAKMPDGQTIQGQIVIK